jgi:predicted DNA-binding transcriptional regulator AlpA
MTQTTTLNDVLRTTIREIVREELASAVANLRAELRPANANEPDEYVDDKTLAKTIGMSLETVQQWRTRDEGPPFVRVGPRCVRYRASDVREWMASNTRRLA